ncbi:MAG: murein biosynthesis integral membrane protein MurJ [Anaerolineae bacterium]|nr:murein biosynthesis integral membrane protein MurJ [Anaerolineae bacterium]
MDQTVSLPKTEGRGIAQATGIIALGSIASRVLGLVREQIIAFFFGASGLVSAFGIAEIIPKMIYDMLIGGMLSAALVPVFSEVREKQGEDALWALFSRVASLVAVVLAALILLLEVFAPQVAWVLGGGFEPELQAVLVRMIRIISPAALFFGLSGVVTGLLYARKRFTFPAFGAAVYNLGTIIAVPALSGQLDAFSLAVGVLLGSLLQLAILSPDLRGVRLRFRLDLSNPALRRILVLYLPIVVGLLISNAQIAIDRRLASGTGASSVAWMDRATRLVQLPHGVVAVAISLAVLPSLSAASALRDEAGFRRTLGIGLRLVLVLILPATLGLLILAEPAVALLFQHGQFTALDTFWTAWALRFYLLGLTFAAIDWPLNYAFYARQDTLTPALVGVLSVGVYLAVALSLLRPLGMLGLVLADSAKHFSHALTMLVLTQRRIGSLADLKLGQTTAKTLLAAGTMAGVIYVALIGMQQWRGTEGLVDRFLVLAIPGGLGVVAFVGLAALLRVDEMRLLRDLVFERLRGRRLD